MGPSSLATVATSVNPMLRIPLAGRPRLALLVLPLALAACASEDATPTVVDSTPEAIVVDTTAALDVLPVDPPQPAASPTPAAEAPPSTPSPAATVAPAAPAAPPPAPSPTHTMEDGMTMDGHTMEDGTLMDHSQMDHSGMDPSRDDGQ